MFCRILCCFVAKSLFYAIYAVLSRNLFCRYLRALAWRKVGSKSLSVEKKGQISGMWVRELQQANLQGQPDKITVSWQFSITRGRGGEIYISSTSLESKADIPKLSHSAFSCWAIVVRGANIEVVEPGVK